MQQHSATIAYVAPRFSPYVGGVETHVARLAEHAAARGYRVEVLAQETDRRLVPVETIGAVTVRRFYSAVPSPNYTVAPGLWSHLARHGRRYDLVHAHSYHALPALGAALATRRPLVFTPHYHGSGHSPLRSLLHLPYRPLGAAIFRRASRVICVSEAEATLVRRHFPRAAGRLSVIPNGVDVAALRAAQPYQDARTILLSAGRLEEYKNVYLVVQALAHLDDRFALCVAGNGPARPALEALAAQLGVRERVRFLGRVEDDALRRWFRTAAVYVSMSRHEAFGITLLEALTAGAGVVASDIPAYREVALGASRCAVTLAPLDATPLDLAGVIRAAAERPRQASGQTPAVPWETVAARTLALYQTLLR